MEDLVTSSKCEKVDERSDGLNMKKNMIMASVAATKPHMRAMRAPMAKALSMPDMEDKMTERFKQ